MIELTIEQVGKNIKIGDVIPFPSKVNPSIFVGLIGAKAMNKKENILEELAIRNVKYFVFLSDNLALYSV